jgi:hypothetical protein
MLAKRPAWIPGVRKAARPVLAEEDHAVDGRDLPPLVVRDEAQRLQIAPGELADGGERLGSGSEVESFRVEAGMGCSSKPSPRAKRRSSSISSASTRRLVEPTRTYTPPAAPSRDRKFGREALGWTWSASTCVRRQGRISISGTSRGRMPSRGLLDCEVRHPASAPTHRGTCD